MSAYYHGNTDFINKALELQFARARHAQLLAAMEERVADSAEHHAQAQAIRAEAVESQARKTRSRFVRAAQTAAVWGVAWMGGIAAFTVSAEEYVTPVRVSPAVTETIVEHQRVTGSLRAVSRSSVAAEEAGAVTEVMIDEGQTVRAGQVIARIDADRHQANLAELQAEVLTQQSVVVEREAELFQVESDMEQLDGLAERQATTARELRDGRTAVLVAQARLQSAKLRVESAQRLAELAQIQLDDLNIVAPFDGRVVSRHIEPGEWVDPGDAIVTLVSGGTIEARLEVPERFAPALTEAGSSLSLRVVTSAGSVTTANVRPVPEVDARARTFPVIAEFDNANDRLSPGMSVTAWVPAGSAEPRLTVPKDAVIQSARGAYLFVVESGEDDNTHAVRNDVRVLFETGDRVVLAANEIPSGALVVVEGNERLGDDTLVQVLNTHVANERLALKR
ncbi:MAG: efflux RND transporter periplasmic adaptor subunit [Planctomycetota bacterium]